MEYIIAAMLAVAIVLLIVLLIKQGKAGSGKAEEKIDNLASTLGAEFERSRREQRSSARYACRDGEIARRDEREARKAEA